MKRIQVVISMLMAVLVGWVLFSGCSKSSVFEDRANQFARPVFTPDSVQVGSIVLNREANGDASVTVRLERQFMVTQQPPLRLRLLSATLPEAELEPVSLETGISHTNPVRSTNHGLVVSFDALTRMGDLRLVVTDQSGALVISSLVL